uniref:Uncharacterized protein n=1 Tax=Vespula pensylvanica TaxID=30213 RepID=A0A834P2E9_VESPE|nr:hypothetical protein H0235_008019 [Vespula pensylvanica]
MVIVIGLDRTQAVSESGSGGCPPEVVMAGAVLVVVVGTGSGCRACMSQRNLEEKVQRNSTLSSVTVKTQNARYSRQSQGTFD